MHPSNVVITAWVTVSFQRDGHVRTVLVTVLTICTVCPPLLCEYRPRAPLLTHETVCPKHCCPTPRDDGNVLTKGKWVTSPTYLSTGLLSHHYAMGSKDSKMRTVRSEVLCKREDWFRSHFLLPTGCDVVLRSCFAMLCCSMSPSIERYRRGIVHLNFAHPVLALVFACSACYISRCTSTTVCCGGSRVSCTMMGKGLLSKRLTLQQSYTQRDLPCWCKSLPLHKYPMQHGRRTRIAIRREVAQLQRRVHRPGPTATLSACACTQPFCVVYRTVCTLGAWKRTTNTSRNATHVDTKVREQMLSCTQMYSIKVLLQYSIGSLSVVVSKTGDPQLRRMQPSARRIVFL